jgi:N-acetylneuraminic acid mutarotase
LRAPGQTSITEIYDPASNSWQSAAPLPEGVSLEGAFAEGAVRLPSGDVLLLGINAQIYDPPTNSWSPANPPSIFPFTDVQQGINATTAILLPNGTVLAAGGYFLGASQPEIYDPVMQAWTPANVSLVANQSLFPIGTYGTVTALQNGDVLVEGGMEEESNLSTLGNSMSVGALYDPTQETWSTLWSNAHAGYYAASGVLSNGKVLVTGGSVLRGDPYLLSAQQTTDLFDPTTNTWSPAAPMSEYRRQHTATVLQSGQMLVTGGVTGNSGPFDTAEIYDPASNTWSSAGFMNSPRYQHTASLLGNGKVLVAGGNNGDTCTCTTFVNSVDLYNPTTNSFTAAGALLTARYAHTATVLANGKVLVTGGFGGATSTIENGGAALASAEIYDPTVGTWAATGSMNSARMNHTATLLPSGKVLVAGGSNGTSTLASAEVYDPTSGTWTVVASMTTRRQSQGAVGLSNGTVLVVGGLNDTSSAVIGVGTLEIYDPTSNTWNSSGAMVTPRQFFVLDALADGRVLLDGGIPNATGLPEFFR